MKNYTTIVWDWNGTLLDDVQVGLDTLNCMLRKRGLPELSLEKYRDVFGFPVQDFYEKIGFDMVKESFHELSVDFVKTYDLYAADVTLNDRVPEVLDALNGWGLRQYILSALQENLLEGMVKDYHIGHYFQHLCGSDNIYAAGKIERGKRMVKDYGLNPSETLMIGDTLHDAEVAAALGFDCLLFAGGHNSKERLEKKANTIESLATLLNMQEMFIEPKGRQIRGKCKNRL